MATEQRDIYASVPQFWNTYTIKDQNLDSNGFATYRLHVKTNIPPNTAMGFKINTFSSAYNLYVNEILIASNGKVGRDFEEEVGEYKPLTARFYSPSKEFDIIIQVSNFHHARGGFWYSIFMGSNEEITKLDYIDVLNELILIGALLIVALFYFAVYYLRREFKYSLYFAILCIFSAISIDVTGKLMLKRIFDGLSLEWIFFIWYSATTWSLFFMLLYLDELYRSKFSRIVLKIYLIKAVISQILYIFTPMSFYSKTGGITNIFDVFVLFSFVIIVALRLKKQNKDGWMNIISMFIIFFAYYQESLYMSNIVSSSISEAGVFIFVFIQMMIQAIKINEYYDEKKAAEFAFMQAQIKPHFLYNSLNTIAELCEYESKEAGRLILSLSKYLRGSLNFENLEDEVSLKKEIDTTKAYVDIEKARFKNLNIVFDLEPDIYVMMPPLTLQPLVENAIRHGIRQKNEGGTVKISVLKKDTGILFIVEDDGVGVNSEVISKIKSNELFIESVGLYNINNRLLRMYKKGLNIESELGKWTRVSFYIPTKGKL